MRDDPSTDLPPVGGEGVKDSEARIPTTSHDFPLAEGMCLSGWLEDVRHKPLLNHRTTVQLPERADYVVIGSGVGFPRPPPFVALMEAS